MLPPYLAAHASRTHPKDLPSQLGQPMLPVAAKRWFKSQGGTGLIPVSAANEPAGRNLAGGADKAERRLMQGAARRSRRQAQQCPVKDKG